MELFKLVDSTTLTVQREVLNLLTAIADTGPKTGYKQVNHAAKQWALAQRSLPYQIIVDKIQSPDSQTRINAIALLNVLLQQAPNTVKRARLCERLMEVEVMEIITKQKMKINIQNNVNTMFVVLLRSV